MLSYVTIYVPINSMSLHKQGILGFDKDNHSLDGVVVWAQKELALCSPPKSIIEDDLKFSVHFD